MLHMIHISCHQEVKMDLAEEKMSSAPTVAISIYILKTAHLTQSLYLWKGDVQEVWPVVSGPIYFFQSSL